ncbi:MAG TPA: flagellar type III secretion system pore protein FliP [Naasia sp.]
MSAAAPARRRAVLRTTALITGGVALGAVLAVALPELATAVPVEPTPPTVPTPTPTPGDLTIQIDGGSGAPSSSIVILLGITLLSVAPALLLMMSSFTKIFVVLALTRNALGLNTIPPNQVIAGLALFLSMFIMWPVLTDVNDAAVQPYLAGQLDFGGAIDAATGPLKEFMLAHVREEDIALMTRAAGQENPANPAAVPLPTLIPAFMISELRAAFIIGLVIFVPFLVIDLVVSSGLMAMGMMMLPPTMIALPFKILLFILVDGWGLIITSLIQSYGT